MVRKQVLLAAFGLLQTDAAVASPAGKWTVALDPIQAVISQNSEGAFGFECQTNGKTIITASRIGLETSQGNVGPGFKPCSALKQVEDNIHYDIPVGRTTSRSATYKTQSFDCETSDGKRAQLDIRVGRDGCGFRTKVPDGQYEVTAESSTWTFAADGATYLMDDPDNTMYEGEWIQSSVSEGLADSQNVMMPYLADVGSASSGKWALLTEGDVDGRWQGSQLAHSSGSLDYNFQLSEGGVVKVDKSIHTPWRIAVIGDLATLFKSHFDQDNSPATNITDLSWIKPGPVSWHYLPEPSQVKNYTRMTEYIDLAVQEKWPYFLIDEGWIEDDIPKLVQYGEPKGVGVIIWYNSDEWNSTADVAQRIADMKRWGVKGAKIDFFLSDAQGAHIQMDYILSQTAEAKLMINFHGCPPPRGRQRQWPHLMTAEGILGDESYSTAFGHTITPLTRNLIGSMDFTPSLYTAPGGNPSEDDQRAHSEQCSVGCGLGKAIVFESGWQHPSDWPEIISRYPLAVQMYKRLPTAWQDSDLLSGSHPGKAIVVGRRSDPLQRYYFGGIFSGDERTFDLKPTSLPRHKTFVLDVVHDSPGDDRNRTAIERTIHKNVRSDSSISIHIKSNGGFSAVACDDTGANEGCLHV